MIYAVAALAVSNLALLALIFSVLRSHARATADRAAAYERTLQTMADRIQAPERLPVRDVSNVQIPEPPVDEWNLVGAINLSEAYLRGEEDEG